MTHIIKDKILAQILLAVFCIRDMFLICIIFDILYANNQSIFHVLCENNLNSICRKENVK